ncbi:MAG: DUF2779 domain-containing protein [Acidobacteriota bacterium]
MLPVETFGRNLIREVRREGRPARLSKSRFMLGLRCPLALYLHCYAPELADVDEGQQAVLDQGQLVGALARNRFTGGLLIAEDYTRQREAEEKTRELLADPTIPAVFEAAFRFEDIRIRVDVLKRLPGNRWALIEVKSSNAVKDYHVPDLAIQKYVLEGCGLAIGEVALMHLNRAYVYDGLSYDLERLFVIQALGPSVAEFEKTLPEHLKRLREVVRLEVAPPIDPGVCCGKPFACAFADLCAPAHPDGWVGQLPHLRGWRAGLLEEQNIQSIYEIPEDFPLTDNQRRICDCVQSGEPYFDAGLAPTLGGLRYPLCFMDFETVFPALPRYRGMRPYDQIPFQWSLHIQRQPDGPLEHYQFLAEDSCDPREAFLTSLLNVLETVDGHILVYNQGFEGPRLKDLAAWFPEYALRLEAVSGRLVDLLQIVRKYVYHPDFLGSFSIKSVLPALVPGMTYEGMEVAEGGQAGVAYERLISGTLSAEERNRTIAALQAYCSQDTRAMAEVLRVLRENAR